MPSNSAYTVRLFLGGLAHEFEDVIQCPSDAAAIEKAKSLLMGTKREHGDVVISVLVGRGAEEVSWLGAWHWNEGPEWMSV